MEQVLDLYTAPPDPQKPLIVMDEAAYELTADVVEPVALQPGRDAKQDHHYDRRGSRAVFLFLDPHRGWRRVKAYHHRTRLEWAIEIKHLLDVEYADAPQVQLLWDNLNTHHLGSLYFAFPAAEAHRLAKRLELIHTPRNGSWLNIAEIELSVLQRQCLDRRIANDATLERELQAWQDDRNAERAKVLWKFSTADARVKLHHLYPQFLPTN